MNELLVPGIILAAAAAIAIIGDLLVDAYYDWDDRRKYRRATNPRNIEKNSQDMLEKELQLFLLEHEIEKRNRNQINLREELEERARNKMNHPSNWKKTRSLDDETKEILAKLSNPKEDGPQQEAGKNKNFFPYRNGSKENYWLGE